jgi:DNA (cytosine-5)-methyltransferase 1
MIRCAELFTGLGGLALSAANSGVGEIFAYENDIVAVQTLRDNIASFSRVGCELNVLHCDLRILETKKVPSNIDLLCAGSPCQPYSISGKQLGIKDEREGLFHVLRFVEALQPKAILVENVLGLLAPRFATQLQRFLRSLCVGCSTDTQKRQKGHRADYEVHLSTLNAADFGSNQHRRRVFIVAIRKDCIKGPFSFPVPTHSFESLQYHQTVSCTYWKEHHVRQNLKEGGSKEAWTTLPLWEPDLLRWRTVRDLLKEMPEPDSIAADPWHVMRKAARIYAGHTGSSLDLPSKAIKAGVHGVPGGENMIRLSERRARYFTIRECGTLQGFPSDYVFAQGFSASMRLIGNAVPVGLGEGVLRSVIRCIAGNYLPELPNRTGVASGS